MASHSVAIAKASLAAGLLRPDPSSVSRDEITKLHTKLDDAITKCTPANIQTCKNWLLDNVVPSSARTVAFGKYVAALSSSLDNEGSDLKRAVSITSSGRPSARRKCLHILYLINDLLHHTRYHSQSASVHAAFASNIQQQLPTLAASATSIDDPKNPKRNRKLSDLLGLWDENGYYSQEYIRKLRQAVDSARTYYSNEEKASVYQHSSKGDGSKHAKGTPFVMPATHGDTSTPWYDLPAGNLIPHIIPNSTAPINPKLVRPMQFMAGPAEESLVGVVKDFLQDVSSIYDDTATAVQENQVADIDDMGQPLVKDEITGALTPREGYYGWSISFCERMKKRRRDGPTPREELSGRSRSPSFSQSPPPRKRRRESSASSRHSRSDTRSRSRSRSAKRRPHRNASRSPSAQRQRYSSSRSPAPRPSSNPQRPPPSMHARHPEQNHPDRLPPGPAQKGSFNNGSFNSNTTGTPPLVTPTNQLDAPFPNTVPPPPMPPPQSQYGHNFPIGPNALPMPPPPPFHSGPWPPSMPGIGGQGQPPFQQQGPQGFVPPPPPPPGYQGIWHMSQAQQGGQSGAQQHQSGAGPRGGNQAGYQGVGGPRGGQQGGGYRNQNAWHSRPDPRRGR
ncbi:MAG: hypothetical protein M1831_001257 [Alyxoria varia]|nr:MAG: hypothetical protein M1831_001257 [Alyxoria varia]